MGACFSSSSALNDDSHTRSSDVARSQSIEKGLRLVSPEQSIFSPKKEEREDEGGGKREEGRSLTGFVLVLVCRKNKPTSRFTSCCCLELGRVGRVLF